MRTSSTYADWIGANLYNIAGDKVRTLGDIYCDDDTGEPEFVTVATDLIGTKTGIIPIALLPKHRSVTTTTSCSLEEKSSSTTS